MSSMSRRGFLTIAGGVAAGAAVGGRLAWGAVGDAPPRAAAPEPLPPTVPGTTPVAPVPDTRVLVIVQMSGGNDGLNTLVPAGQGRYFDARPSLRVSEDEVLALPGADAYGFHPELAPLLPYWNAKQLAAVEAVGLPEQSRSHFVAMDAWWSATPGQTMHNGWVGRWLDRAGDPSNPLRAISLGGGSPALRGDASASTLVRDPKAFTFRIPKGTDALEVRRGFLTAAEPRSQDDLIAAAQSAVPAAVDAVDALAIAQVSNDDPGGGGVTAEPGSATDLLQTAAGIIDLDLGTKVIVVNVEGFDTHSNQAGAHPRLLGDVAGGIAAFLQRISDQGRANDVLVMTTSEFGRRVRENGGGTDHGNGGVQFLIGAMVDGGRIVGDADLTTLDEGDLRPTIDARSLYANALDWLGGPNGPADEVLGGAYDRYGLVRA